MKIELKDIRFRNHDGKVRAVFLKYYYFDMAGDYKTSDGSLMIEERHEKKAWKDINHGLRNLTCSLTGRPAIYVDRTLGLPLIGSSYFGIIDRNTSLIEVRPNTGCNLDCIYCSVDEGKSSKKLVDFIVEKDYMIEELKNLIKEKKEKNIEIHINPQGEPTLYPELIELIRDMDRIDEITKISMDTNGILLTKDLAKKLHEAGLSQLNISIDAVDEKIASKLSGCSYPSEKILSLIPKLDFIRILIAPIYVPGINESEIPKLVEFAKKHGLRIGIQNFLPYRSGRNPNKGVSMEKFFSFLKKIEKELDYKLIFSEDDFEIRKTKKLECPFRKDEIITVDAIASGRNKREVLASARGRTIQIRSAPRMGKMKIRILRTKHNIISAIFLK